MKLYLYGRYFIYTDEPLFASHSWLSGGCPTLADAKQMLIEFTTDILTGENHAEL